jgi:hypothetical protein
MTLRRPALLVLSTLALSLTPVQADAAAYSWTNLVSMNRGHVQSCRVPTPSTEPWKLRFRVNATRATSKLQGTVQRYKGTTLLAGGWRSDYIRPGQVSAVAVVRIPRGTAYNLGVGINSGQAGTGNTFRAIDIPRC